MASEPHRQHRELVICSRQSRDGDHLDVHVAPEARDLSHYIVAWFRVRWDPGPHPNPLMLTSTGESFATVQAMALAACSSYCLAVGQSSLPCSCTRPAVIPTSPARALCTWRAGRRRVARAGAPRRRRRSRHRAETCRTPARRASTGDTAYQGKLNAVMSYHINSSQVSSGHIEARHVTSRRVTSSHIESRRVTPFLPATGCLRPQQRVA